MSVLSLVKSTGDKLTANEFNAVVEAINSNADNIEANANNITTLANKMPTIYYMTQTEYDAAVEAGSIDSNADYNIYEE